MSKTLAVEDSKKRQEIIDAYNQLMAETKPADGLLRLDIGCGKNKKEGFIGLDQYAMEGVDVVWDVRKVPWMQWPNIRTEDGKDSVVAAPMFEDNSVDEVHCSHFIEHLSGLERVQFLNELYRVMKPGAKALFIAPHWCSNRAYGDFTHQWPPIAEMWLFYLSRKWREDQAPHNDIKWNPAGYTCDFEASWGYSYHPALAGRNQDYVVQAQTFWKEACQDIQILMTKLVDPK